MQTPDPRPKSAKAGTTSGPGATPAMPPPLPKTRSGIGPWICLGFAAGVFCVVGVVIVWQLASGRLGNADLAANSMAGSSPQHSFTIVDKPTVLVQSEPPKQVEFPKRVIKSMTTVPKDQKLKPEVVTPESREKPLTFDEITKDIRSRGTVLSLPKREQGIATPVGKHELCKIYVKQPADCDLKLVTTETTDHGQPRMRLIRDKTSAEGIQSWTVITVLKDAAFGAIEEIPIGQFTLKDQSLNFEWKQAPDKSSPFGLLYCKLDVHVGSEKIQCSLTKPTIKIADRLDLAHRKATMPVDISAGTLSSAKFLRYDIELSLGDWSESRSRVDAEETRPLKFEVPGKDDSPESRIDLEIRFVPPTATQDAAFSYRAYIHPTYLAEIQGPRWDRITKRNDEVEGFKLTKEGFIVPDFKAYRAAVVDRKKRATKTWEPLKAEHGRLAKDFPRMSNKLAGEERDQLQKRLDHSASLVAHWLEAVKFGDESLEWAVAMEKRFEEIQAHLDVRYTVYLEFQDESNVEKIMLVETNPPPSKGESKSSE